ncbi:MAG: hypothetical protein ACK41F_03955 [Fimbriimonadaceae bacterium]
MRSLRLLSPLLLALAVLSRADTFGALQFDPPAGERRISPHAISYSSAAGSDFVVVTAFRHAASQGSPASDFAAEWAARVRDPLKVAESPKGDPLELAGGWTFSFGMCQAKIQDVACWVTLGVYSGHGVRASVRAVFTNDKDIQKVADFFDRVKPLSDAPKPSEPLPWSGFSMAVPEGFRQSGNWQVKTVVREVEGRKTYTSLHFRLLDPVPVKGNMGEALVALSKSSLPSNIPVGTIVFRRYVGEGLASWFLIGRGREEGRKADTLFSLHLIDLGTLWQPLVIAQTYEDPDGTDAAAIAARGAESFAQSAKLAEEALKDLTCPGVTSNGLATDGALVGEYEFGKANRVDWAKMSIGPARFSPATRSGSLKLAADGSYRWTEEGKPEETGRWKFQKDLLALTPAGGSERRLRLAALSRFASGEKFLVLLDRLDDPVNALTVGDASTYFLTKPQK